MFFQYFSTCKTCYRSSVSPQCPIIFSISVITFYLNFTYLLKFVYSIRYLFPKLCHQNLSSINSSSPTKNIEIPYKNTTDSSDIPSRSSNAVKISHPFPPLPSPPFTRVYKIIERGGNTFHRNVGRIGK